MGVRSASQLSQDSAGDGGGAGAVAEPVLLLSRELAGGAAVGRADEDGVVAEAARAAGGFGDAGRPVVTAPAESTWIAPNDRTGA